MCTKSSLAPTTCPFGDTYIRQIDITSRGLNFTLPSFFSKCQVAINASLQQLGMPMEAFCNYFDSACCQTCRSEKNLNLSYNS